MKRNPVARDLRSPKYRMRVVASKKGKGSFKRKEKHQSDQ
jgi:stalled ribosome alternative rescue factor ArfA